MRTRVRRGLIRLLRLGLVLYVLVAAVLFSLQTRIIFPGSATQGDPSAVVRPRPGEELVRLKTAQGDSIVALFGPALRADGVIDPQAAHQPTVLYFYGNGMCLRDTDDEFQRLRRLGFNVLIPEYAGYGMSGGSAGESGCIATADAAYDHLLTRKDVDPARIVAAGWSLGGAVAIDLAARRPVAGLVSFCTFTSLPDMARRDFPFLPARLLLRHRFDNASKIARVTCPILLGHGRRDELIPFAMSDRLAALARSPVTRLTIDDAGHNDFYDAGGQRVFEAVRRFVEGLPASKGSP
ncbi:MAG: alpha/beta hydrolase [Isosphaeraceae bacterium]|nr:alpha/beta hydrolase [Isosphaeraceae bacterium]